MCIRDRYHYDTLADVAAELVKLGGGVVDVTAREESGRVVFTVNLYDCLLYTSPSPRDRTRSRMPSSA